MTPERLLELYDEFSDAPGAVERLRQFVLELATRGKLTEQVESDFGQLLLDEIIRCNGANSQKKRNSRSLRAPQADTAELKKILPQNWALATLGQVASTITDGTHHTPTYVENGVPFVTVKNFSNGNLSLENTKKITVAEHKKLIERVNPRRGDILIARIGTLGKAVVVDIDTEFSIFVSVGLIRFDHQFINPTFFRLVLNSPFVSREFDRIKVGGGTHTNKLNLSDLHTVAFPLPPIEEQGRIVARVDELMGLCDELEAEEWQQRATRDRFTAASFEQVRNSETDVDGVHSQFFRAIENFDDSVRELTQISALKGLILDLAVTGRLTHRLGSLEDCRNQVLRSIDESAMIATQKSKRRSTRLDVPQSMWVEGYRPKDWAWVRLGDLASLITKGSTPTSYGHSYTAEGVKFVKVESIVDNQLQVENIRTFISEATHAFLQRSQLQAGDILFSIAGTIGTCALVTTKVLPANTNQALALIRGTSQALKPDFLMLVLKSSLSHSIKSRARGGAMNNVSLGDIQNIVVPVPTFKEQELIIFVAKELMGLCDEQEVALVQKQALKVKLLESALSAALNPNA